MGVATLFLSVMIVGIVLLSWRLLDPALRIAVGEKGIRDRTLGLGWIRWDEIEGVWQPREGGGSRVQLRLRVSARLSRLLKRRSPDAVPDAVEVPVDLSGTHLSGIEVIQEIVSRATDLEPDRS